MKDIFSPILHAFTLKAQDEDAMHVAAGNFHALMAPAVLVIDKYGFALNAEGFTPERTAEDISLLTCHYCKQIYKCWQLNTSASSQSCGIPNGC